MIPSESVMPEVETNEIGATDSGAEERQPYAILWVAGGEVYLYDDASD